MELEESNFSRKSFHGEYYQKTYYVCSLDESQKIIQLQQFQGEISTCEIPLSLHKEDTEAMVLDRSFGI